MDDGDGTLDESPEFISNQDKGDTKVILHVLNALNANSENVVTIRSPSGDSDILILMISNLKQFKERVILDDFHGITKRKSYRLSDIELEDEVVEALVGFHAFTGNDFVSSFFRKGKLLCFQLMLSSSRYKTAFAQLGESWELSDDTFRVLQLFVVNLYGVKKSKNVDDARYLLFKKKFENEDKTLDMSTLPPCESVLRLHCNRANYLAAIWKRANTSVTEFPDAVYHGWNMDKSFVWVTEIFPEEIESILVDPRYDPDNVNDAFGESEEEDFEGE